MKMSELTKEERDILQVIRGSKDPVKVTMVFVDIMQRVLAGEDIYIIAASYGVDLFDTANKR